MAIFCQDRFQEGRFSRYRKSDTPSKMLGVSDFYLLVVEFNGFDIQYVTDCAITVEVKSDMVYSATPEAES